MEIYGFPVSLTKHSYRIFNIVHGGVLIFPGIAYCEVIISSIVIIGGKVYLRLELVSVFPCNDIDVSDAKQF